MGGIVQKVAHVAMSEGSCECKSISTQKTILAVQLAERALTACNYPQNHLLALSVDVIGSASTGVAQHGTCVSQFLQIPWGFLYVPVVAWSEVPAGIASLVQYPPLPIHSFYLPTWYKVAIIVAVWLMLPFQQGKHLMTVVS